MQTSQHQFFSAALQQQMNILVYGEQGKPALVFPPQGGVAGDFAGFGMVEACREFIEQGRLRLFCVDSVDNQSWAAHDLPPAARAQRHEEYDRHITQEVCPFIAALYGRSVKCLTAGCSMGGYHAGNFFFRRPELFDTMISLSGLFDLRLFIGDYMDQTVYYNSPLAYLPHLNDKHYLDLYARSSIIICTGQGAWEEEMIEDARAMEQVLSTKDIPHWVDFWGYDVCHDWPWWKKQWPYFLSHCSLERY